MNSTIRGFLIAALALGAISFAQAQTIPGGGGGGGSSPCSAFGTTTGTCLQGAGALGTPSSGTATNLSGTAAGLTAGHVTTNANLTGVITSSGNATSIASQTGTGTKFVVDTNPVLVTPNIGTPSAGVLTNATGLVPSTGLAATGTPTGLTCLLGDNTWGSCAAGGTGVTNVATGACLTGGPITTTGTVAGTYVINAQTGTSYTIASGDACKLVTFSNGSSIAVTLPQATSSFGAGYSFDVENKGAGVVTITPTTSTINGASTLTLSQNTGCSIVSDGTNYQVSACTAVAPSSGTVTSVTCNGGLSGGAITTTGTCSLNLSSQNAWAAEQDNCVTTLTISTATFTPDGSCNNYKIVLVHASCPCTLANWSTTRAGAAGVIEIDQSATGSDTISTYGSQLIAAGGTSTLTYSSGANAKDFFSYYNADTTHTLLAAGALNASH